MNDERTAKVIIEADTDDYQKNIKASAEQTNKLSKGLDDLTKKLDGLTKRTGNRLMLFGAADIAALGALSAIAGTLQKQMSSIEASAANINKNLRGYEKFNVNQAREDIRSISRELPVQRAEVAQTMTAITKMGVTNNGPAALLTDNFLRMGGATGESPIGLAAAQIGLTRQMGNMSPSAGQVPRYNNVATGLSTAAGVDATGMLGFADSLSGAARAAGISQTDLMGISTAFTRSGQDGMYAANTFNSIINEIARIQKTGSPTIKKYANVIGVSNEQTSTMNPLDIFSKVISEVSQSGNEGTRILEDLGLEGPRTMRAIQGVAAEGGINKWINEARMQYSNNDAVGVGSQAAFGGFFDEMETLKNKFTDLGQVMGEMVLPPMELFATTANKIVGLLQPILEPLARLGGLGAAAVGAGALGLGAMFKNWAAVSTPALAQRVVGSSYLSNFREGMLTGTQAVSGQHSDNMSLRNLEAGRLGPLQRFAFRAGAGIGAFGEQTYGKEGLHPVRMPTNLALMGLARASSFLGKGAGDFYRDATLRPDERIKPGDAFVVSRDGETERRSERKRPNAAQAFGRSFMGAARYGPMHQIFGRYGDMGLGGADLSGAEQAQAVAQADKYQKAYEATKSKFMKEFGMGEEDADRAARDFTKDAKLSEDEKRSTAQKFRGKVDKLMQMTGLTRDEAEKRVVTSEAQSVVQQADERAQKATDAATPMGRLTTALDALTATIRQLISRIPAGPAGPTPPPSGDPRGINPPGAPMAFDADGNQLALGPGAPPERDGRVTGSRANTTPMPTQAARTGRSMAGGIWSAMRGAGAYTAGTVGLGLGTAAYGARMAGTGLINAVGGPAALGLMAGIPAAMWAKDTWDKNNQNNDMFRSGTALNEDIFNSWNKALENSTGKLYKFADSLNGIAPASNTAQEAFSNFAKAEKEGENKEEVDFAAIEYMKNDPEQLVSWIKSQNPTGADADKMYSDLYKVLGGTEAKRIAGLVNDPNYQPVASDQVGSLLPYITGKTGEDANSDDTMGITTRALTGSFPGSDTALGGATQEALMGAFKQRFGFSPTDIWGTQSFKDVYTDPESAQAKSMEAWFGEYSRTTADVTEKYDTGEEGDKTAEAYRFKTASETLTQLISKAGTDEGNAALQVWLQKFSATPGGANIDYNEQELQKAGASGNIDIARAEANRVLASSAVGKDVEGMSTEQIDAIVTQMKEDPWGASNRKYVKEVNENEFYKTAGNVGGKNVYSEFATTLAGNEKFSLALGEERESGKAQFEAVKELKNLAKEQGTSANQQQALLQTIINSQGGESQAGQLAAAAQALVDFEKNIQTSTMNNFGQTQQTLVDVEEYKKYTDPESEGYQEGLTQREQAAQQAVAADVMKFRQYERTMQRGEEDYQLQTKWQEKDYEQQRKWATADFYKQRERQVDDYHKSVSRSREDFQLSMSRSEEDYQLQNERSEYDYLLSRKRSNFEFELSLTRNQEDFQRQRRRSNKEYNIAMERQLQTTTKAIMSPFQRQNAVDTVDSTSLMQNVREQNNIFKQLMKDVDKLKSMGMTQETIDNLGLADINNWQQTRSLAQSMTKGQIRKVNKMMGRRKNLVEDLTQDGKYNRDYRWQTEDRERQLRIEDKEFQRSVNRQVKDYKRGLRQQQQDWEKSIERRDEDWEKSIDRQRKDFRKGIRRQRHDFKLGLDRQMEDWELSMDRQEKMTEKSWRRREKQHQTSLDRMHEDFIGFGDMVGKDTNELLEEYNGYIDKFFNGELDSLKTHLNNAKNEFAGTIGDIANITDALTDPGAKSAPSGQPKGTGPNGTRAPWDIAPPGVKVPEKADGGIVNSRTLAWIGERGQEAILPLDGHGVDIIGKAMFKAMNLSAKSLGVANRGMTPNEGKMRMSVVNNNTNFSGITVVSQDPDIMAKKLKHKARMVALRSGSRKDLSGV